MEIGTQLPHTGSIATPTLVREWCLVAEQAGFDSIWGNDHILMPRHVESIYTASRHPSAVAEDAVSESLSPNFEMVTSMAYAAAITERIKIGSGVAVLTLRNALLNARQLATIDRYSGGRVLYGVGIGWMREEADAMKMPWDRRGARAEEHIALLRAIWTAKDAHVEFDGEFWQVPPMDPEPRPAQDSIPILIGGHSDVAIDRAVRLGDGWITGPMSSNRLEELLPQVELALKRHDRDPSTLPIYCRGGDGGSSVDELRRYEALGVHSLQIDIRDLEELEVFAETTLPRLRES